MANQTVLLGSDTLKAALLALGARAPSVLAAALYQEAETVMTQAKGLTPVDTGALRASGHVEPPVLQGDTVTVTLGFGTDYAVYVHENLTARHPVGEAKFLERPVLEWADVAEARLAAHVGKAIEAQARAAR
jgi:hypothetical protein